MDYAYGYIPGLLLATRVLSVPFCNSLPYIQPMTTDWKKLHQSSAIPLAA